LPGFLEIRQQGIGLELGSVSFILSYKKQKKICRASVFEDFIALQFWSGSEERPNTKIYNGNLIQFYSSYRVRQLWQSMAVPTTWIYANRNVQQPNKMFTTSNEQKNENALWKWHDKFQVENLPFICSNCL
jgi:hypothetical protein